MNLPSTLSGYWEEYVERIGNWLAGGEWLDQDTFDQMARAARQRLLTQQDPVAIRGFTNESMLPPFDAAPGSLPYYIATIQEMTRAGLVEARERNGKVEYRVRQ